MSYHCDQLHSREFGNVTINTDPFNLSGHVVEQMINDLKYFQAINWQFLVLDEAQAIKNSSSSRWNALLELNTRNRLLLTGTPIQNSMQ